MESNKIKYLTSISAFKANSEEPEEDHATACRQREYQIAQNKDPQIKTR
jgi:hypothetical protein